MIRFSDAKIERIIRAKKTAIIAKAARAIIQGSIQMKKTALMLAHPGRYLTILLSVLLVLLSGVTRTVTAASVEEDLVIDNLQECLDCTESNCLYCESQHEFTTKGKHFSMCYCPASKNGSLEIVPGYCGTVFAHFNRYAQTERYCIFPQSTSSSTTGSATTTTGTTGTTSTDSITITTSATTPVQDMTTTSTSGEQVQEQQESQIKSKSSSISASTLVIILIGLLPLMCCLGVCTGCGLFYYFYHLKKDLDEERRLQECTAMMKVVTARDLDHDDEDYSSSNMTAHTILIDVEEMEQQRQQQHQQQQQLEAKNDEEQELKEHHVIT